MSIGTNSPQPLLLYNKTVERVKEFTYLGSFIDKNGGTETDIASRIQKAGQAFGALSKIWTSCSISLNTKLRLFNSNVKPAFLYECETWNEQIYHKLQVFLNRIRRIF